jgi:uncharacterized repeat protein (TIGR03803 family)
MSSRNLILYPMLTAMVIGATAIVGSAPAQTEMVLYSFSNQKDSRPFDRLLLKNGTLYGTAPGVKGSRDCCGEVFQLTMSGDSWEERKLLRFNHVDKVYGRYPQSGLIAGSNGSTLYGTTYLGGSHQVGTAFELQPSGEGWTPGLVWTFGTGRHAGGFYPAGELIADGNGALYGVTLQGGTHGFGVIFELSQSGGSWVETVLYNFRGGKDGANPSAALYMDTPGSLWGTTAGGGGMCGCGTVFHLVQSGGSWIETVVHRFGHGSDGALPLSNLIEYSSGNFYGTTDIGGQQGLGTVFELFPAQDGWKERVIYNFCSLKDCRDGEYSSAGLAWGATYGTMFGTTFEGGAAGLGTVFSLTYSGGGWNEAVVHSFAGNRDGADPFGGVILDGNGNLYGTTTEGGAHNLGTAWEITP